MEYFRTGRGNKGLRIGGFMYKRHYETTNSVYWICTLSNKYKCKQRVIAERGKQFNIRFKGPGHNHDLSEYQNLQPAQKTSLLMRSMIISRKSVKDREMNDSDSNE